MNKPANTKKVVVLGGGYAGVSAAKALNSSSDVSLTLIDRHSFQVYTSSLYEAATEEISRETVIIPFREIFNKRVDLIQDEIVKVDKTSQTVYLKNNQSVQYDFLVVALGATSNDFGIPGVKEHAFMLRELKEAVMMRDNFRTAFHMAFERMKKEVSVVICGGGFSGVELAAELRFHLDKLQKQYSIGKVNISVLEAGPQVLPGMSPKLVEITAAKLKKLNIEIFLGDPVAEVRADGIRLKSGKWIASDVTAWTAGTKPNPLPQDMVLPLDDKNRPVVNESLQVVGLPNVFVAGDLAGYINPKTSRPIPPQAYQAIVMGKLSGENILRSIKKLPLKTFKPKANDFIIPVGHNDSVAIIFGQIITGILPSILIKFVEFEYLAKLFGVLKAWPKFWAEVRVIME